MASIATKICANISRNAILTKFVPNYAARAMCTVVMKHKPTDFEKKVLVWAKKYKNVNEVPEIMDLETVQKARGRVLVRITNYAILLTGGVLLYMVYNGHNDQTAHKTLADENMQWHEQNNKAPGGTSAEYFDKLSSEGRSREEAVKITMSSTIKLCSILISRNSLKTFSRTALQRRLCSNSTNKPSSVPVKPSEFEKKMMVFARKYKTVEEIPEKLHPDVIELARNRARIRFANYLIVIILMGCCVSVFSGKRSAELGDTVHKANVDFHIDYNKKAKSEEEYASKFEQMVAQGEKRK
ncbi:uncharacterized protein LOC134829048 [Culicoides brevitarsis]|uniref:uncharacterized protein LOC134829048 n=1 Tax=Culicoides brevitarsis TaxID=469753 RepID=UPI00307B79DE